jgi:hypothetical protein
MQNKLYGERVISIEKETSMKTQLYFVIVGLLLLVATSCAVTDFDRSADFTRYRTFAWGKSEVNVKNPVHNSKLINKNIKTTVENELAKRGISRNDRNPDFTISYHTYTEQKQEATGGNYYGYPFSPFRFYPYGFGWALHPYGTATPRTMTFTEGTLIIDITDSKTNELVWRGTVSGNVDNVSNLEKQIRKGIKAILKKYPVTPQQPLPLDKDAIS